MSETITIEIKQKHLPKILIVKWKNQIRISGEYDFDEIPIERSNIPALREALLKFYEGKERE